jgi:hypothetical protein
MPLSAQPHGRPPDGVAVVNLLFLLEYVATVLLAPTSIAYGHPSLATTRKDGIEHEPAAKSCLCVLRKLPYNTAQLDCFANLSKEQFIFINRTNTNGADEKGTLWGLFTTRKEQSTMQLMTVTGLLLIAVPIAFNATFFLLQRAFEYPNILRKPTDHILRRFKEGGAPLRRLWYAFALSAVLFLPVPILVHQVFDADAPWYLVVGTAIGVLASLVQIFGLIRWSFLVPTLADIYSDPAASPATRDSAAITFQAFHRYAGVAIGEHLGYLFTSTWTLLLSIAILQTAVVNPLWGWLGIVPALGVFVGVFEETGFKAAGVINAVSYILWSAWLIGLGVVLLLG